MRITHLLGCCLLCVAAVSAADERSFIVGVEDIEYLPYYSPGKMRGFTGIAHDILHAFADSHDYRIEFRAMPVLELCQELEAGRIDFKFPFDQNWHCPGLKIEGTRQSLGFISYHDGVMIRPEHQEKTLTDFRILGTLTGFTPVGYDKAIAEGQLQVKEYARVDQLLQGAIEGEVQLAFLAKEVAKFSLRVSGQTRELMIAARLPVLRSMYRIGTKKHPEVIREFDQWALKNEERIRYIARLYGVSNGALFAE